MRGASVVLGLVAAFAGVAFPPPARAQQDADAALQAAKAEFEEGQTLFVKERFEEAAVKFAAAYDKKPFGAFLFNAAVCLEKAKKVDEAVASFEKYLQADPEAKDAADVKARIAALKASLVVPVAPDAPPVPGAAPAAAAPAPVLPAIATKGLVIIDSKPPGAAIYLDDKKRGLHARTPWQGSLDPGTVKIIVEAKGFKPEERRISPRTDKIYEVYVALSEEFFLGWIEVVSNVAGADVFIDRQEIGAIGRTPYTGNIKPGKHTIWVRRLGYQVAKKDIEVQPGTATTINLPLERVGHAWITVAGRESKGGTLMVDGAAACKTPCQQQVTPGKHKIEVVREGMEPYRSEVDVERAQETRMDVRFSPKPSRSRAVTSAVISALFLGGGIALGLEGRRLEDELASESKDPRGQLNPGDSRVQRGKYMYIGADALFGLSALTAILAAWGFLSSGPDSTADVEQKAIGLAPLGLPGGAGLAAGGRF